MRSTAVAAVALAGAWVVAAPACAAPFFFSTGDPDGRLGAASRPAAAHVGEVETADDFVLTAATRITSATFTGLITAAQLANVSQVGVEIYRVFPFDSDTARTPQVPTRANSPSDVALDSRDSVTGGLTFAAAAVGPFTVSNSIVDGLHPKPNQLTGGEGPASGLEVTFTVTFATPFDLAAGHYYFAPQVGMDDPARQFLWLSTPMPIPASATPFAPDLQSWSRNASIGPDWLRDGTDVTQQGPFNMAFSLSGMTDGAPEPAAWALMLVGFGLAGGALRRRAATA